MSSGPRGEDGFVWDEALAIFVLNDVEVVPGQVDTGGVDATLNTPYRNMCYAYFDDCLLGGFNRCPTIKFILRKSPACSFDP